MKKWRLFQNEDTFRILLIVLGSILSTIVLTFAVLAISSVQAKNLDATAGYIFTIFVILGLSRFVTYLRERTKVSLVRFCSLFIVNILIGILVFFGKNIPYFYSLMGGLFCVSIVASRVFKIIENHSIRGIVLNSIYIALFTFLAIGLFIPSEDPNTPLLFVCVLIIISSIMEVLSNAFSQLKMKTLIKIVFRTFAFEIILGLLTLIVAASLVFMHFEDTITTFADGLWYSFAVVTTIGFGDFAAVTPIGRIMTVILGIYGIVVVAVITSIIVNFYNETTGKKDAEEFKAIKKEEKKKR